MLYCFLLLSLLLLLYCFYTIIIQIILYCCLQLYHTTHTTQQHTFLTLLHTPFPTHPPLHTGHSQESINAKHVRDDQLYNEAIQNVGQSYGTVYMGSPPQSLLPLSVPQGGAHPATLNASQTLSPHVPGNNNSNVLYFLE